ncbi:MAG TPA: terminase gpA endonuclease subunit [Planctomycetaceae bacterium]|jgi:phage terminase large subunit GpA-like protein|nr:terminase gpA endonuclease subunit [Planctomycetaceae bacterium]
MGLALMALFYGLNPPACRAWLPRPSVRTVAYAQEHIYLPAGSEIQGKFRIDLFPYMEEVLDCCDDPRYERVSLQAASRTGKTVAGQVKMAATADTNPHPMAFGDADERSTRRVLKRTWDLFSRCESLAKKLPRRGGDNPDHIPLSDCIVHGAWSGSPATAADFAAWLVVLNEVDKGSTNVSAEADFVHLMAERAKGYRGGTVLCISTPAIKGSSRIEALRLAGDNRSRHVACPFCNHFQTLRMGDSHSPGGLKWDKDSHGKSTPQIAFETAWYECEKCQKKILDQHRYTLMNSGLWVPDGMSIHRGRVVGKPTREGRHASFGPLSTLHSLLPSITWGSIAREFLESHIALTETGSRERLRNFVNSWLGETWDPKPKRVHVHELTERLGTTETSGRCPAWAVFVTRSADVAGQFETFPWQACAWGSFARGAVIDYGTAVGEADLEKLFREKTTYPHADGGAPVRVSVNAVDSGASTDNVYAFCNRVPNSVPLKGVTGKFAEFTRIAAIGGNPADRNKLRQAAAGFGGIRGSKILWEVNHERTQSWIQAILEGDVTAAHAHFFSLCQEASLDHAFLAHLSNEFPSDEVNEDGYVLHKWIRTGPNEQRDLARYNRSIADVVMGHGVSWSRIKRISVEVPNTAPPRRPPLMTPDGRPFVVLNRKS